MQNLDNFIKIYFKIAIKFHSNFSVRLYWYWLYFKQKGWTPSLPPFIGKLLVFPCIKWIFLVPGVISLDNIFLLIILYGIGKKVILKSVLVVWLVFRIPYTTSWCKKHLVYLVGSWASNVKQETFLQALCDAIENKSGGASKRMCCLICQHDVIDNIRNSEVFLLNRKFLYKNWFELCEEFTFSMKATGVTIYI